MGTAEEYVIIYEENNFRILKRLVEYPELNEIDDMGYFISVWDAGVAAQWVYMHIPDQIYQKIIESNMDQDFLTRVISHYSRGRFTLDGEPKSFERKIVIEKKING